jgi:membrane protease YdiL (CAAX protease family)
MSLLEEAATPMAPLASPRPPRIWKFVGTSLWGLFGFAAMFLGQIAVVGYFLVRRGWPIDFSITKDVVSSGLTISLSVIMGLPAVTAALWLATRMSRTPFADYLALRGTNWRNVLLGVIGLIVVVMGWDLLSRALGRDAAPGFMMDVLKSAQADNAVWLLVIAFCIAAPVTEELLVRGFLYRGWSESVLRPVGAIVLSSAVWTAIHLQYDWFFFGEILTIGFLLGYMRWRSNSTWLTILMHALNNTAATVQTLWLAGHS